MKNTNANYVEKDPQGKSQLAEVLDLLNIKIVKFDPSKQRPVSTNTGTSTIEKFAKTLLEALGPAGATYSEVFKALYDLPELKKMLALHAQKTGTLLTKGKIHLEVPENLKGLTLNFDMSAKGRESKFFLTDDNEQTSRISGDAYLLFHQLSLVEAVSNARLVIPEYLPRHAPGVFVQKTSGRKESIFNSYIQPSWHGFKDWDRLPNKLPPLVRKLVDHLFENQDDRTYFWDWVYASLFSRAPVYLILCGDPGIGKNRSKLLLRALHGHENVSDGKRSTITERFNSQIPNATLLWFDELKYDNKMENAMKELPNDTLAIERKGVDSTRGTRIHASFVISNNKPRDNYIAFDSRKFSPLSLTKKRLEESMGVKEIDDLTKKLEDPTTSTYDVAFIAQTVKWLQSRGSSGQWPNLEYRGPMFWYLAHTSMAQYQKGIVTVLNEYCSDQNGRQPAWDESMEAFLWSKIRTAISGRRELKDISLPDFTTVQAFLETYRDKNGRKVFETIPVPGSNILGDFWIKPINGFYSGSQAKHGPIRPPGMSEFQWKKVKAESKTVNRKGLSNVRKETDDL